MGRGMLSVETIIIIVMCLLVLILSAMYVLGVVGPGANTTQTTANIYSECMNWQRFGYIDTVFTQKDYPALWQTYLSGCLNDKKEVDSKKCDDKALQNKIASAKGFCTNEKTDQCGNKCADNEKCVEDPANPGKYICKTN
jgi:hypothetical protein